MEKRLNYKIHKLKSFSLKKSQFKRLLGTKKDLYVLAMSAMNGVHTLSALKSDFHWFLFYGTLGQSQATFTV